jgi:hypothetical protein
VVADLHDHRDASGITGLALAASSGRTLRASASAVLSDQSYTHSIDQRAYSVRVGIMQNFLIVDPTQVNHKH